MPYAVIMAGGSGKRLWPLSRKNRPKQIIEAFEGQSLLRRCVDRVQALFDSECILVVTNSEYADVVRKHLPELPAENIIPEPIGRDTSNAIGLAATVLHRKDPESIMAVFSSDQILDPIDPFINAIRGALKFLENHPQALFTFGIKASYAHTGFGYLKRANHPEPNDPHIFPVEAFKEKPNKSTARKYIRSGNYCWNSGMFVWRTDTILKQLDRFLPHNYDRLKIIGQAWGTDHWLSVLEQEFPELEKISIDFGVLERAVGVYMTELDCHWLDVGSYQTLADTLGVMDQDHNVTTEKTASVNIDSTNNIIISTNKEHLISTIHVEDMIIVHTDDATLICHREETDHLKKMLEHMQGKGLDKFT